jgi:hypothetical protein
MHVNYEFKNFMAHKKIWHAMTNIGAINSRHTKIYDVTKIMDCHENLTPCCQMACHVIITWKTKLLLIASDKNI